MADCKMETFDILPDGRTIYRCSVCEKKTPAVSHGPERCFFTCRLSPPEPPAPKPSGVQVLSVKRKGCGSCGGGSWTPEEREAAIKTKMEWLARHKR